MKTINKEQLKTQIVIESIGKQTDKTFKELAIIRTIKSKDDYERAASLVKQLKEVAKSADVERRKIVDVIQVAIDKVNEHFKPFTNKVKQVEEDIKTQMKEFLERNQTKIKQLEEQVETGAIDISKYAERAGKLNVEDNVRRLWRAEIVDEKKIPREFLIPNVPAITKHLREGGKPIPGVKWDQEITIAI